MQPSEVVVAFAEGNGRCDELASQISLEFINLDVKSHLMPLRALLKGKVDDEIPLDDAPYDISCELTRLGRLKVINDKCPSTILVFIVGKDNGKDIEDIAETLKEWAQDFRISRDFLGGLCCSFVVCMNEDKGITNKVADMISMIRESLESLGARVLMDEVLSFGPADIGQIVTFKNIVKEAFEDLYELSQLETVYPRTGNNATLNPKAKRYISEFNTVGNRRDETSVHEERKPTNNGCYEWVTKGADAIKKALTNDDASKLTSVNAKVTLEGAFEEDALNEEAVTPVAYTSASEYESSDDASEAKVCGSEEDLENLGTRKKMVSETQRKALTKQGYRLIGDHSAIKLCRWTKSRVRGRGGCYKHTFYGIRSNQCMEMTPNLSCANKCVFCWRHHTNPVATKWQWPMDDAAFITEEGVNAHLKLIRELRGMLDARSERFTEALQVRHCALSLVGEPIMYPQINELLHELHLRKISTFLVTNAQFPKQMESLRQVTQFYVSIDAADKNSLKNIDRPLFKDYWARFKRCIKLLKNRKERTVFRLTLVKQFNISEQQTEISDYAELIELGEPDFVEIKAVTFCGTVHDNAITMQNVPWHDEVIKFSEALVNASGFTRENYSIACEHRHSCCVLVARNRFLVQGKWHTWIDYDKFHELAMTGKTFDGLEYSEVTPDWALFGSKEEGFDPVDTRVYTKGRRKLPPQVTKEGDEQPLIEG